MGSNWHSKIEHKIIMSDIRDWISVATDIVLMLSATIFPLSFRIKDERNEKLKLTQKLVEEWNTVEIECDLLYKAIYANTRTTYEVMHNCIRCCDLQSGEPNIESINVAKGRVNKYLTHVASYICQEKKNIFQNLVLFFFPKSIQILNVYDIEPIYDILLNAINAVEPFNWVWHQLNGNCSRESKSSIIEDDMILRPDKLSIISSILFTIDAKYLEKKCPKYFDFLCRVLVPPDNRERKLQLYCQKRYLKVKTLNQYEERQKNLLTMFQHEHSIISLLNR